MIKTAIHWTAATILPIFARVSQHRGIGIIMGHGVFEGTVGRVAPPRSSVSMDSLRRNILSVGRSYTYISMDEVADMIAGAIPWRKRSLALTFDDSLKCHAEVTAPKLVEWGIPATFYLSTEAIDLRAPYWWLRLEYAMAQARGQQIRVTLPGGKEIRVDSNDRSKARQTLSLAIRSSSNPSECINAVESVEAQLDVSSSSILREYPSAEPMTWDDARKLRSLGMTIGSHTVSHPNLTRIGSDQLQSEFVSSRQRIEQSCDLPCHHLCYPHGFYSEAVCQAASMAGYTTAVTTLAGWFHPQRCNPYSIPRFAMPDQPYKLGYVIARELIRTGK